MKYSAILEDIINMQFGSNKNERKNVTQKKFNQILEGNNSLEIRNAIKNSKGKEPMVYFPDETRVIE